MRKFIVGIAMLSIAAFFLAACGSDDKASGEGGDGKLKVVTSFTIIEDMAKEVGGDNVEVTNLVPTGTDPHEYEPTPDDIKAATDADVLFYNGLNLEGGEKGWFFKMLDSTGQDEENAYLLTEDVEPMYIGGGDSEHEEEINPHAFIDPGVGIKMTEALRDAFVEVDPDNKEEYEKSAEEYLKQLKEIDKEYEERINEIPEENRVFVTSERAFQYMTSHYGLKEGWIWEIDTDENGSTEQITSLVEFLEENEAPVVFTESNVDPRPMETVSNESGVPNFEDPIYSDEIGGEGADTYLSYLEYNIDVIAEGLGGDKE